MYKIKEEYLECSCHSPEHIIKVAVDTDPDNPSILFLIQLIQYRNIFKRLWVALKYVLGYQSKYGHWDCVTLENEEVTKLQNVLKFYKNNLEKK